MWTICPPPPPRPPEGTVGINIRPAGTTWSSLHLKPFTVSLTQRSGTFKMPKPPRRWCFAPLRAEVKGAGVAFWLPGRDPVIQRSAVLIHSFKCHKETSSTQVSIRNLQTQMGRAKQTGFLVNLSFEFWEEKWFPGGFLSDKDCFWWAARSQGSSQRHLSLFLPLFPSCAVPVSLRNAKTLARNFLWDV